MEWRLWFCHSEMEDNANALERDLIRVCAYLSSRADVSLSRRENTGDECIHCCGAQGLAHNDVLVNEPRVRRAVLFEHMDSRPSRALLQSIPLGLVGCQTLKCSGSVLGLFLHAQVRWL